MAVHLPDTVHKYSQVNDHCGASLLWVSFKLITPQLSAKAILILLCLNGTDLGKCTHQHDKKQENNTTQAFSIIRLLQVKEDWQTTKEEGSKEEDRQEGTGPRNKAPIALPCWRPTWQPCLQSLQLSILKQQVIPAEIFSDLPQKHILCFISSLADGIIWVPQHLLMHPQDNKNIHIMLSGGSFFSHFYRSGVFAVNNGQWPGYAQSEVTSPKLCTMELVMHHWWEKALVMWPPVLHQVTFYCIKNTLYIYHFFFMDQRITAFTVHFFVPSMEAVTSWLTLLVSMYMPGGWVRR